MKEYHGENFAYEIVDSICEDFKEDETLIRDMLYYLYHTTNDDAMMRTICEWFTKHNYCLECGSEMQYFEYEEVHDELEGNPVEVFGTYVCPICGKDDIYD